MIESLLVPFDSTDGARHALEKADRYADRAGVPVDLVVVGSAGLEDRDRAELRDEARRLRSRLGETLVLTGDDVASTLLQCAHDHPSAQLWMATHGRSRLGGFVLGSTAEAVIRGSHRPTALVGPNTTSADGAGVIAVCVDDLAPPPSLIATVAWWATRLSCSVRVVCATPSSSAVNIEQVVRDLEAAGTTPEPVTLNGNDDVARSVVDYAEHEGVDLIAMATHARTGIRRALAGTVTMSVVHHAGCPVLVQAADDQAS